MKELNQIEKVSIYYFAEVSNQMVCIVRMTDGETLKYYGTTRSEAYKKAKIFLN
jgi:hypothetical protein